MSRLRIRTRLVLAITIPLLALFGLGVRYLTTIDELAVDGRLYDEVTGPGRVENDVALLAENQSRALINAQQIRNETLDSRIDGLLADLEIREEQYLEAAAAWSEGPVAEQPELVALLEEAYGPSVEFYRVIEEELVPAVEAGDDDALASAIAAVERAYAQQRAASDRVIDAAREQAVTSEAAAAADLEDTLRRDQLVAGGLVLLAVVVGALVVRSITRPLRRLEHDLPTVAEDLRRLDLAEERPEVEHLDEDGHDELSAATRAFTSVVETSVDLAVEQARVRHNQADTLQHLGRRNQNLLRRMMAIITDLERSERDPDALQELFRLDHIATRMRRNAESLLVLAGSEPPRRWSQPVPVLDVVRSAASEIEDYDRVDIVNLEAVVVEGSTAADIAHLLAELLENATLYSPPTSRITVTGRRVRTGYQVAVVDQGLGMDDDALAGANERIRDAASSAAELTHSKLLGLHVVGRLADRHDIRVDLTPNPAGGLIALVTLPRAIVALPPSSAGVVPPPAGPVPATAADPSAAAPAQVPATGPRPAGLSVAALDDPVEPEALAPVGPRPVPPSDETAAAGAPGDAPPPTLRRRVRSDAAAAAAPAPTVHGPARSADAVRDSWGRLAQGVEQARREHTVQKEDVAP